MDKKNVTRIYFSAEHDLALLKEVVGSEVWPPSWKTIADTMTVVMKSSVPVGERAVRERAEKRLLQPFISENNAAKNRSGVEEDFGEKELLLQEYRDRVDDHAKFVEGKKAEKDALERRGQFLRDQAMKTLKQKRQSDDKDEDGHDDQARPKRGRQSSEMVDFLRMRADQQAEQHKEEMVLRRQELEMQRQRQEMEMKERAILFEIIKNRN